MRTVILSQNVKVVNETIRSDHVYVVTAALRYYSVKAVSEEKTVDTFTGFWTGIPVVSLREPQLLHLYSTRGVIHKNKFSF